MKKLLLAAMLLFQTAAYAQYKEVAIISQKDEMTGKQTLYPSRNFVICNGSKSVGFTVMGFISADVRLTNIAIKMVGLGACADNSELIILFQDERRIVIKSWNKFNCEGNAYFMLTPSDVQLLGTYPMLKMRVTNGRTKDQYTGEVPPEDANYFIDIIKAAKAKTIIELKN